MLSCVVVPYSDQQSIVRYYTVSYVRVGDVTAVSFGIQIGGIEKQVFQGYRDQILKKIFTQRVKVKESKSKIDGTQPCVRGWSTYISVS